MRDRRNDGAAISGPQAPAVGSGRILAVLEAVTTMSAPTVLGIAAHTGIDKSAVSRACERLCTDGWLRRDRASQVFEPGPRLLAVSVSALGRADIRTVAAPHLRHLRDLTAETASLQVRIGNERVCIDGVESPQDIRRVLPLGERIPLYAGPSGKVILAHLPEPELSRVIDDAVAAGVNRPVLTAVIDEIRSTGYLITIGDRTPGVAAISAPIFESSRVTGSITVAGPAERMKEPSLLEFAAAVTAAAQSISTSLGGSR